MKRSEFEERFEQLSQNAMLEFAKSLKDEAAEQAETVMSPTETNAYIITHCIKFTEQYVRLMLESFLQLDD